MKRFQHIRIMTVAWILGAAALAIPLHGAQVPGVSIAGSRDISNMAGGITGDVQISADTATNSILVMTDPANYERIRAIVNQLDGMLPQALIKVLFAEVTHGKNDDYGTDFAFLHRDTKVIPAVDEEGLPIFGDDGLQLNRTVETIDRSVSSNFNVGAQTSGMIFSILESDFELTLRAIQEAGKLEVLSRPSILAINNQEANITVGQEVPFITDSRITNDGQTINTIEYEDIGIILNVTPHINVNGVVTLDVETEISTLTADTVQISETLTAPVIAKRAATTRVAVPSGRTLVIGGLMEDQKTSSVRKVPFLGDIPWLGFLFSRTINEVSKTELMIFLTPHVIQAYDDVDEYTAVETEVLSLIPSAIDGGPRYTEYQEGMSK